MKNKLYQEKSKSDVCTLLKKPTTKEESINPTTTIVCKVFLEKLKNQTELEKNRKL